MRPGTTRHAAVPGPFGSSAGSGRSPRSPPFPFPLRPTAGPSAVAARTLVALLGSSPPHREARRARDRGAATPVPTPTPVPARVDIPPVRAGRSAESPWRCSAAGARTCRPPRRGRARGGSRAPAVPGSGPSGRPVARGWPARAGPYRGTDSPIQEMRCGKIRPTVS
ncbi:hypothetical protein G443_002892 [Actinoalloteichus cyanogriseus DSM 43889]|uniref:Uncharacterized protein n=1 Tax=Actinoalloteichus caeruleus DSM 43889 TaxID=1120930 RepID=A0ABT1JJD7_ACTCY|nr:hypothetical protein [Actinoalloteichus caeruleus DSM 43889]